MIENKKGVSMIVSTMIIILLVIVAVGILWFAARGIFEGGANQLEMGQKCMDANLQTTVNCVHTTPVVNPVDWESLCTARIERKPGGEDIGGVKLIYTNGTSNMEDPAEGNIATLGILSRPVFDTELQNVTKLEVWIYFEDETGRELLCSGPTSTVNI